MQAGNNPGEPVAPPCSYPAGIIRFNQVGYYPSQEKVATVNEGTVDSFTLVDTATERTVFTGKPAYTATSPWSDKVRSVLDFSSVTTPGTYWLLAAGDTATVVIDPHALLILADGACAHSTTNGPACRLRSVMPESGIVLLDIRTRMC